MTLDLSGMGGPTSSIHYCQHSSWDHVTTQAPLLHQSWDTFRGIFWKIILINIALWSSSKPISLLSFVALYPVKHDSALKHGENCTNMHAVIQGWPTCGTLSYLLVLVTWIKATWSRYRPGVAQRVGRGIALLFHDRGTRRGWLVNSTPWPHFTPREEPVTIVQEAGCAPGLVWTGGKSRPNRDWIPAHSQSLYRLSYLALVTWIVSAIL